MGTNNIVEMKIDQDLWVIQIKDGLKIEEDEEEKEFCACVFNVPNEIVAMKRKAYIPQTISIGPYHHWRSELYEMERYKLVAARRFQKRIKGLTLEFVVEELRKLEWQIRSCYHKYIDYTEEALSWLMALDACFVLECLQFYVKQGNATCSDVLCDVKQLGKVLDPTGKSSTHNAVVRDLMMLENQIPLFLLQKLLELQLGSAEKAEEWLCSLVKHTCMKLSPFKFMVPDDSRLRLKERGHILEVLYYIVVPPPAKDYVEPKGDENDEQPLPDTTYVSQAFSQLWTFLSSLNVGFLRFLTALPRRLFKANLVQFMLKLPLRLFSTLGNLPFLRVLKGPLTMLSGSMTDAEKTDKDGEADRKSDIETTPTRDELAIPSITELYSAGIKFLPTDGDITTIHFDKKTATLYLPVIKLDANTEVILRNLVAFEASAAPGESIFTRYTDFMNGMIDDEEDVKLLRNSGIVFNHLETDGKVASLWNGMGKCVKLTKVQNLDKVIADVNKYYKRRWSVAIMDFVKAYIFGSWKFLSLLAAVILLLLTCLQAFCSVYNCKKWFTYSQG